MMFSLPSLGLTLRTLMDLMEFLLLFSRTVLPVLTPCLVKLFRLCPSTSTFPSCWKYAYIQPVPKKGDRSNFSSYRPIALLSCISRAFETILNKWFLKHLTSFNLLSDLNALLAIFLFSLIIGGHPLLVVSVKLLMMN